MTAKTGEQVGIESGGNYFARKLKDSGSTLVHWKEEDWKREMYWTGGFGFAKTAVRFSMGIGRLCERFPLNPEVIKRFRPLKLTGPHLKNEDRIWATKIPVLTG